MFGYSVRQMEPGSSQVSTLQTVNSGMLRARHKEIETQPNTALRASPTCTGVDSTMTPAASNAFFFDA